MIELHQIDKQYDDYVIFKGFDYRFEKGHTYALVGESGAGKTTLLNIIGKLEDIQGGEVLIEGKNLKEIKEKTYFKDYVSYLFQNYGLIENRSIKENLELAFIGQKLSEKEKATRMLEALSAVNLSLSLDRKVFSLSGGEAQRVAIAKVMLKNSPIILADEPTASLDEKNSREIIDLILGLQNSQRLIIIATHDATVYQRMETIIEIEKRK